MRWFSAFTSTFLTLKCKVYLHNVLCSSQGLKEIEAQGLKEIEVDLLSFAIYLLSTTDDKCERHTMRVERSYNSKMK